MTYRMLATAMAGLMALLMALSYFVFLAATSERTAPVRGWAAQYLIERAWQQSFDGQQVAVPWPGLKSYPVARLQIPALGRDMVVMRGTEPEILAHGPGWHEGSEEPGRPGIAMISGYRDSHFDFMRSLQRDMVVRLSLPGGGQKDYVVDELAIVQAPEIRLDLGSDESVLLLSTSYPVSVPGLAGDSFAGDLSLIHI